MNRAPPPQRRPRRPRRYPRRRRWCAAHTAVFTCRAQMHCRAGRQGLLQRCAPPGGGGMTPLLWSRGESATDWGTLGQTAGKSSALLRLWRGFMTARCFVAAVLATLHALTYGIGHSAPPAPLFLSGAYLAARCWLRATCVPPPHSRLRRTVAAHHRRRSQRVHAAAVAAGGQHQLHAALRLAGADGRRARQRDGRAGHHGGRHAAVAGRRKLALAADGRRFIHALRAGSPDGYGPLRGGTARA